MDETICSERRISNEQLLPAESVHTVAVPLQSAVQSTYIINEMTTIEFSSNRTLQIHFMFSAAEDQMNVFQFKILISNELRGTIIELASPMASDDNMAGVSDTTNIRQQLEFFLLSAFDARYLNDISVFY